MLLGIIVATLSEEAAIKNIIKKPETVLERANMRFIRGVINRTEAVVVRAGVGKVNAAVCAQIMISEFKPDFIINTGAAGGLKKGMRPLDVVIAADAVQHDFDTSYFGDAPGFVSGINRVSFPTDEALSKSLFDAAEKLGCRVTYGRVLSGDQFVDSDERKKYITETFDGSCVEMEAAGVAQACFINSVPCAIMKTISDCGGDDAGMQYDEFLDRSVKIMAEIIRDVFLD